MKILLTTIVIVLALAAVGADTIPPQPAYGSAVVDGDILEWDLNETFFADMYEAGKVDKEILSTLHLQYNARTHTLYALVLRTNGFIVANMPDDAFVKLGNTDKLVDGTYGNDGSPPDFEWVIEDNDIVGWEASMLINTGVYQELNVKTQIEDDRTAAVSERGVPIYINGEPTAITIIGLNAESNKTGLAILLIVLVAILVAWTVLMRRKTDGQ